MSTHVESDASRRSRAWSHFLGEAEPEDPGHAPSRPSSLIGTRYQVINELGEGGIGLVYRVLDRLTGRVLTLKKLKTPVRGDPGPERSTGDRLSLAREFQLLASLRHPNIISVLDYGFDADRDPFLTMDLEEHAETITDAARGAPMAVQVELLVQTLRALLYLHRHGIIHRDVKPENVLVVRGQVKVLDFGLAVRHAPDRTADDATFAGTLAYMAPEILGGAAPTERCDLYGVGMLAYEMLIGRHPFEGRDYVALRRHILETPLPRPADELDPRFRAILARLLAKDPAARYEDGGAVITDLAAALDSPLSVETVATRESFLQTAPLIGRDAELGRLMEAVHEAARGRGSAWLVVGESGIGKTRLLDEVRTRSLVEGLVVAHGRPRGQGGGPYHVWHDVVAELVLHVDLDDADAAVLKTIVPEVERLLGRSVDDPPVVHAEAAQSRLLLAVEEVVRLQPEPALLVLEDLQWVGSESLHLWNWLARVARDLPIALLGSVRSDETPDLPAALDHAEIVTLDRLEPSEIAAVACSMIGRAGDDPALVALLERETEGIAFFLVETVRALAERAGGLAEIGATSLPARVVAGGMQKVVRRRLREVSPAARSLLETAAVAGRAPDLRVLAAIHPDRALDDWLTECASTSVLELRDQEWRFRHDKLREQLLEDIPLRQRRDLHRAVAEALERTYPGRADQLAALAYHWRHAGDGGRERSYAYRAGELALLSGACDEAITLLGRALDLWRADPGPGDIAERTAGAAVGAPAAHDGSSETEPGVVFEPDGGPLRLGMIEGRLCEAHYRLGDLKGCREHGERALAHFGHRIPRGTLPWMVASLREGAIRAGRLLWRPRPADAPRTRWIAAEIGRVYVRLTWSLFYNLEARPLLWSTLRFVNQCESVGPTPELALAYVTGAVFADSIPVPFVRDAWARRALEVAQRTGDPGDIGYTLSRISVLHLGSCRWEEAEAAISTARESAEEAHDVRHSVELRCATGALALFTGQFERGLGFFRDVRRLSLRSGNRQTECWGLLGEMDVLVNLGRHEEAIALGADLVRKLDEDAMRSEAVWHLGILALAHLRSGDRRRAHEVGARLLAQLLAATPVIYYVQRAYAAAAEVFVELLEAPELEPGTRATMAPQARRACGELRGFARRFPIGRAHAALWDGVRAAVERRPRRAAHLLRRALRLADQLGQPYERARAHLEIGRRLPTARGGGLYHIEHALHLFTRLGCAFDRDQALGALADVRATSPFEAGRA